MTSMARFDGDDFLAWGKKAVGSPASGDWSDTDMMMAVNQAQLSIAVRNLKRLPQLRTSVAVSTSADTGTYEVSVSNIIQLDEVENTTTSGGPPRLKPRDHNWWIRRARDWTATGAPIYYIMRELGSNDRWQLSLLPVPDGVYALKVWYYKVPEEIIAGSNVNYSTLPQSYDLAIRDESVRIAQVTLGRRQASMQSKVIADISGGDGTGSRPKNSEKIWNWESRFRERDQ